MNAQASIAHRTIAATALWLFGCCTQSEPTSGFETLAAANRRADSRLAVVHLPAATGAGIRGLALQTPAIRLYLRDNAIAFDNVQIISSWLQLEPHVAQREVLGWLLESDSYRQLKTEQAGKTSWTGTDWVRTQLGDFYLTAAPAERRLRLRFAGRSSRPHPFAILADKDVAFETVVRVAQSLSRYQPVSLMVENEGDLLAIPVDVSDCRQSFGEWPASPCSTIVLETDGETHRVLAMPRTYRNPLGPNEVSDVCVRPSFDDARELLRSQDLSALLDASRTVSWPRCGVVAVEVSSSPSWERIAAALQVATLMSERNYVQVAMRAGRP